MDSGNIIETNTTITIPKNYNEITYNIIIQNKNLISSNSITATNAGGNLISNSDVILYKTSELRFGKLMILNIDDANNKAVTIKAVTYKQDGTLHSMTESLLIRGSFTCDLDTMVEYSSINSNNDFWWERINNTDTKLTAQNNALFTKITN